MADASCSGGTPFKRLMDHQSRDVSHHQDRFLHGNQTPASFRSTPQHSGDQDARNGFNVFMGAPTALTEMHHDPAQIHQDPASRLAAHAHAIGLQPAHHHHHAGYAFGPPQAAPALPHAANSQDWTAEFSQFVDQLSEHHSQPRQQQQRMGNVSAAAATGGGVQQAGGAFASQRQVELTPYFAPAHAAYAQRAVTEGADFDQELARWMAANAVPAANDNMERVDAAMDEIARELELREAAAVEGRQGRSARFSDLGVPELANLSLEAREAGAGERAQEVEEEGMAAAADAAKADEEAARKASGNRSAVSEAAARLLELVEHEKGEKWQNSTFLALTRDFRDGRKDIIGNEVLRIDGGVDEAVEGGAGAAAESTNNGQGSSPAAAASEARLGEGQTPVA